MNVEDTMELMKFAMAIERENLEDKYETLRYEYEKRLEMEFYSIENELYELKRLITERGN